MKSLTDSNSCLATPEKSEKTHEMEKNILALHGSLADNDKFLVEAQLTVVCSESEVEQLTRQIHELLETAKCFARVTDFQRS